jgi:hypothetical protein
MNPVSPLPPLVALLVALGTTVLLVKLFGAPKQTGRFAAIDGLRGYLAFFVFMHHSAIWYFYLQSGEWKAAPSNLYTHFGQSSVAMFFMITGFLFFTKLLNGRRRPVDWLQLVVSRVLRLAPLYVFAMLCLFAIVAVVSGGALTGTGAKLAKGVVQWMLFTVAGAPDLNGVAQTSNIVARVTWSLPYEWFFYVSLPLLALVIRVDVPRRYVALGAVAMALMLVVWRPEAHHLLSFLGGIVAAVVPDGARGRSPAVDLDRVHPHRMRRQPVRAAHPRRVTNARGNGLQHLPAARYRAVRLLSLAAWVRRGAAGFRLGPLGFHHRANAGADRAVVPHLQRHREAGHAKHRTRHAMAACSIRKEGESCAGLSALQAEMAECPAGSMR